MKKKKLKVPTSVLLAFRGRYRMGGSYVQKVSGSKESSPKWQSPISSITKVPKAINCLSNVFKISWTETSFDVGYETSHISPSRFFCTIEVSYCGIQHFCTMEVSYCGIQRVAAPRLKRPSGCDFVISDGRGWNQIER